MKSKSTKTLQIITGVYSALYVIGILSSFFEGELSFVNLIDNLFLLLFILFIVGFVLSWKREFQAGIIFLLWYAIMLFGSVAYFEFRDSGPWILFGVPILLQGLFYIKNHLNFKSLPKQT